MKCPVRAQSDMNNTAIMIISNQLQERCRIERPLGPRADAAAAALGGNATTRAAAGKCSQYGW
jgi:hypothetical protein